MKLRELNLWANMVQFYFYPLEYQRSKKKRTIPLAIRFIIQLKAVLNGFKAMYTKQFCNVSRHSSPTAWVLPGTGI